MHYSAVREVEMKDIREINMVLIILIILAGLLCGCANRKAWKKVIVDDELKKIKTTTVIYESDTGFDLGTKGTGEYYLLKVEGF
jgi:hypothetical protein